MTRAARAPVIVVGVSGSPASALALRWAADEAGRRHGKLRVVLAWSTPARAYYAPVLAPQQRVELQRLASERLTATLQAVLGDGAWQDVTMEVTQGNAERALVDCSADADLLVLGSGNGVITGRSIGPVIRSCLSHAHCPVVVVGPEGPPDCVLDDTGTGQTRPRHDRALANAGAPSGPLES